MSEQFNIFRPNGYVFQLKRIPETEFRVIAVTLPSISVAPVAAVFPPSNQYYPGSNVEFGEFNIRFIVDENLLNYEELYRWITQQQFKTDIIPSDKEKNLVSDGILSTLNNASVSNRVFYFVDMFPIQLGGIGLETTVTQPDAVVCDATFRYSYFELRSKV